MPEPITFPTGRFAFDEQEIDIERRTVSGGMSVAGDEDVIETDGGGRWFAQFSNGPLMERETTLAWRALTTLLGSGATPCIVPFCDLMHQPYGHEHEVPHSDGSPLGDGAEYEGGGPVASAVASASLRATSLQITLSSAVPLIGGETFSINHPTRGWRAYRVTTVDGDTITFRPPLREAVEAGEAIDFANPRCVMRVDGRPPQALSIGRYGEASIRFVEVL